MTSLQILVNPRSPASAVSLALECKYLSFSPDIKWVGRVSRGVVYRVTTGKKKHDFMADVEMFRWSPDGSRLAVVFESGEVVVANTNNWVREVRAKWGALTYVSKWTGNDEILVLAEKEILVYSMKKLTKLRAHPLRRGPYRVAEFSPNAEYALLFDNDVIEIAHLKTGSGAYRKISDVQWGYFSPDNTKVLLVERSGKARITDLFVRDQYVFDVRHGSERVIWSPDSRSVIAEYDTAVHRYNVTTGEQTEIKLPQLAHVMVWVFCEGDFVKKDGDHALMLEVKRWLVV